MGLLTYARCGCTMTAEKKKGNYVYCCTGFKGACGNTYMREERLAELLCNVIAPIQISEDIAKSIAAALRTTEQYAEFAASKRSVRPISAVASPSASSIAATRIKLRVGSQKPSGVGNRRSGRPNSR